ncbi:MAG: hypothetical protein ABJD24_12305 [Acidimicrobiales bacterium]
MKRVVAFVALAALSLVGPGAIAASAHGADESNYRSVVTSIAPSTTAFTVRTIELGSRLELTVAQGHTVLVNGYDGEPYLRIGYDGVYENFHSPSHWVNKDRYGRVALPPEANSDLPPEWVRVGNGPSVRWHDHRTHWMALVLPPIVQPAQGERHIIEPAWKVPLVLDGQPAEVTGELTWEPAPSALPWLVGAAAEAIACLLAIRFRRGLQWWIASGAAVLAAYVIALRISTNHFPAVPTVCVALTVGGLVAVRYEPRVVVVSAAAIAWGAFSRLGVLHHSLVRFPLGLNTDRALVTVALGIGLGTLAAALLDEAVSRPTRRRAEPAQPLPSTS